MLDYIVKRVAARMRFRNEPIRQRAQVPFTVAPLALKECTMSGRTIMPRHMRKSPRLPRMKFSSRFRSICTVGRTGDTGEFRLVAPGDIRVRIAPESNGVAIRVGVIDGMATAIVGMGLGSILAIAILSSSAQLFGPANIDPSIPGTAALEAAIPFGKWGLILALLGMSFAVAGAAVETCLANAYSIAQFFGWIWGRHKKPWEAPRFTLTWIILFLLALAIVLTGVDITRCPLCQKGTLVFVAELPIAAWDSS